MKSLKAVLRGTIIFVIIALLSVALPISSALAYSDGPRDPGAGTNETGVGTETWQNPGNITVSGSPYAEVTLYHLHLVSNYLQGSQYGFAIPADAAITGIEVSINRMSRLRNPSISDNEVRLVKGGAVVGDNKAIDLPWPTTLATAVYGGPADLWGTTWTPAEVNSTNFGVALSARRDNNGNNDRIAVVDTMQVTVYYVHTSTTDVVCDTPVYYGDSVTCTATVTRISGDTTPTGTVSWSSDGLGSFEPNPCLLSGADGVSTCSATYMPAEVGSGSHLVTATYSGDEYFTPSNASQLVTVNRRPITVTADPQTKMYGDPDPALTYQVTSGSLVFNDAFTGALSREAGEDVGDYAILQGTLALSANYDMSYEGNTFTITKAYPTCEVIGYDVTYDGDVHTATGTCLGVMGEPLEGLDLSATTHTNADTYTDPWTFTDVTGNYNDANGTVDDVIGKADASCEVAGYDVTYDGDPHTATGACLGVMEEPLEGLDLTGTTHTDAGSYLNDPWTFTDVTGNYNDASGTVDDMISKADASCEVTGYDVTYDGNPHTATGTCLGVMEEPLEGLDLTGTTHTDADTYRNDPWTFTDVTGNYNDDSGTVNDVIGKAEVSCEVTGYDVTYDGDPHTATGTCLGVMEEPLEGLDLTGTTHTDADTYLNDPWTFTDVTGNYNDDSGTVNDVIGKAEASCEVTGYDVTYDGEPHTATGTCLGVMEEPLEGLDLTSTTHTDADTYLNDPWTFTDVSGNYNDASGTVDDEIGKAEASCEVTGYDVTYDGDPHTATGTCLGVMEEPLEGLNLSATTHTNADTYTDPWTFTDMTGNYNNDSGTVDDVISKADASCEITGYDVTYDGDPHTATGTCLGVIGEQLEGLDLTGTTHTDTDTYTDPWTFTDMTGNYNDDSGTVDDVINKANASCEVTGYDVTYDGDPHTATGTCLGVMGEPLEGLDLSATIHTNADTYTDPWIFTDATGNYNDASGTVDDMIGKADVSCEVTGYTVTYDGDPHTATGTCLGVLGEPLEGLDLSATTHTNANTYTDPWTFTDVTGNYTDDSGTVNDVIGKADPECEIIGYNVEYDREAHTATGACLGVLGEPLDGLDLSATTHTDIGVYTDPWTFTDVSGNYNDDSGAVDDEITLRYITVTADAQTKVYGQPDPDLTYQVTVGSLLTGDEFSGTLTRVPGENVGAYAILQGTLSLPDYYELTYVGADLTITGYRYYWPLVFKFETER